MDFDWQPLLHYGGDNKSVNYWSTKFFISHKFAWLLTKLLTMTQKNLGIDMIIDHINGILNGYTDAVSSRVPSITLDTKLKKVFLLTKLLLGVYRSIHQWNRSLCGTFSPVKSSFHTSSASYWKKVRHTYQSYAKNFGTHCFWKNYHIQFCRNQLELEPPLKQTPLANQHIVAVCYLDHLTSGHMYHIFCVQYSTLKE